MMEKKATGSHFNKDVSSSLSREHQNLKFGEAPFNILREFLTNLNDTNIHNLKNLSAFCGNFKDRRLVECVFLICDELRLDPLAGYQAIEILERFMTKHLEDLFCIPIPADEGQQGNIGDSVFIKLSKKFSLLVFSCIQLASKLTLHCNVIDNNTALKFLRSMGHSYSKETLLESELLILQTLNFCISFPNPLMYVETLLEVLGYNDVTVPILQLYSLCRHVLQFAYLQRKSLYHSLLVSATDCPSPSEEQRMEFAAVTEDCMLLSVGVIAAGAFILNFKTWEQVVDELRYITGISAKSIMEFAYILLSHIVKNETPVKSF
ncbi:cyclin N-terminal domain-containing protein 1 [Megalops cyprinoides]|uniref:cyclin N-terminal domain-containing protein 1 n=1 Tax=Megalops cyprinoides TaxID=118141 RepID=UPI0018646599|nr:cyclin N-terminal domain-containing protein 1 [Megalops cyprinoides]